MAAPGVPWINRTLPKKSKFEILYTSIDQLTYWFEINIFEYFKAALEQGFTVIDVYYRYLCFALAGWKAPYQTAFQKREGSQSEHL